MDNWEIDPVPSRFGYRFRQVGRDPLHRSGHVRIAPDNRTKPNSSRTGDTAHAARLINTRQGTHAFHADLQNDAEREAERGASRIKSMLPAYNQVIGSILEQSASALRLRSLARGNHDLLMFRGLRGGSVPTTVDDVSRTNYPMRPLTSWSTTFEDAERFAHGANGVVVEALVPTGCLAISPGFAEEEIMLFPVALDGSEATKDLHEINIVGVHQINN